MDAEKLKVIIENHSHWLKKDCEGWETKKADLSGADLRGAYLRGAMYNENTAFFSLQCPEYGAYIGWKKCGRYIVKLEITADSKRTSATTRKCRASKAIVLDIQHIDGTKADVQSVHSNHDQQFVYEIGKTVEVANFDDNRWIECTAGIHHFITRQEAVNY